MLCVSGCNDPKGLDLAAPKEQRVALPPAGPDFGKPVAPPILKDAKWSTLKAWSWRARDTIDAANLRLKADGEFYRDVQRNFGRP
jgi:hypothetical protein